MSDQSELPTGPDKQELNKEQPDRESLATTITVPEKVMPASGVSPVTRPDQIDRAIPLAFQSTVQERNVAFAILLLSVMCLGMGQTILFAVLPPIARELGLADWQVGAVFSVSAVFWVITSPLWGSISDKYGRKPTILLGLGGFSISMLLVALTVQYSLMAQVPVLILFTLLIFFRSIHGAIASAGPSSVQAYMADRTSQKERTGTMTNFAAAFGFGSTIGPGIGSAAAIISPVAPLYAVSLVAALAWGAIALKLPERTKPHQHKTKRKSLKITDKRLFPILVYGVFAGLVNAVPLQVSGFYFLDVLHLNEEDSLQFVGIALMVMSLASLFSQLVLVPRFQLTAGQMMRFAPIFLIFGHLIMSFGATFGTLVFGLLIIGLGSGMFFPAMGAAASLAVDQDEQGSAAGYANSSIGVGFIFSPLMVFALYAIFPQLPFLVTSFISIILCLFATFIAQIRYAGAKVNT